jgi:hypothetical protein
VLTTRTEYTVSVNVRAMLVCWSVTIAGMLTEPPGVPL